MKLWRWLGAEIGSDQTLFCEMSAMDTIIRTNGKWGISGKSGPDEPKMPTEKIAKLWVEHMHDLREATVPEVPIFGRHPAGGGMCLHVRLEFEGGGVAGLTYERPEDIVAFLDACDVENIRDLKGARLMVIHGGTGGKPTFAGKWA